MCGIAGIIALSDRGPAPRVLEQVLQEYPADASLTFNGRPIERVDLDHDVVKPLMTARAKRDAARARLLRSQAIPPIVA